MSEEVLGSVNVGRIAARAIEGNKEGEQITETEPSVSRRNRIIGNILLVIGLVMEVTAFGYMMITQDKSVLAIALTVVFGIVGVILLFVGERLETGEWQIRHGDQNYVEEPPNPV